VLLNQKIDINTNLTAGVKEDTSELVELLKSMKAFGKFLSAVATGSKWFTAIAAACAMIYALMHGVLPSSGK
jgi:succinate dehydrogenase/fumarate reductase cytochrome b subunit